MRWLHKPLWNKGCEVKFVYYSIKEIRHMVAIELIKVVLAVGAPAIMIIAAGLVCEGIDKFSK